MDKRKDNGILLEVMHSLKLSKEVMRMAVNDPELLSTVYKEISEKLSFSSPNAYALGFADDVFGIPTESAAYDGFDLDVPLYAIICKGNVGFSAKPLNTQNDKNLEFLKAVEGGAGLGFAFSDEWSKELITSFNSKETFEYIKNKNDERIMTYINRITNKTIQESVYVKKLSKEDYYAAVVYVFYEDRVDGFKDYSKEIMNLLKDAVDYLKSFVGLHKNDKSVDIQKYTDAIYNGEELISTATIMDIHNDVII